MSPQDGANVIMMQAIINFANLTMKMHIHTQIVSFVEYLEYHFLQLKQIFAAKLFRNSIKNWMIFIKEMVLVALS